VYEIIAAWPGGRKANEHGHVIYVETRGQVDAGEFSGYVENPNCSRSAYKVTAGQSVLPSALGTIAAYIGPVWMGLT
jgi:hypothetical protein